MAVSVPTIINKYSPTSSPVSRVPDSSWAGSTVSLYQKAYGDLKSGLGGASQAVDDFLRANGPSNPPFNTSTSGKLTPNQGGNLKITRGYIRRSSPDSGDAMSNGRLNFMYNPTDIVRDYVSYLDQAALDPFNTIYDSGNLVVAPNFVNFSFTLLFDRQIEAMKRGNKGVLDDYKYFDMVVRNVPPTSAANGVPDNGIMMANPKDITVLFSKDLTVQGRPTNARVQFVKFNHEMIPTRMIVSLTMIITYFGPVRAAYGFDTYQDTGDYEALVPYSEIYGESFTAQELSAAQTSYIEGTKLLSFLSSVGERQSPYRNTIAAAESAAYGQVSGAAGISSGGNGDLALRTLNAAKARTARPGLTYSQASRLGPNSYDCSGLVSMAYRDCGAGDVLPEGWTGSIFDANNAAGWKRQMNLLATGQGGLYDAIKATARPGDLLLRHNGNGSNHILFFDGWDGERMKVVHATSGGGKSRIGTDTVSKNQVNTYTHLMRPAGSGASSAAGPVSGFPIFNVPGSSGGIV